MTPTVRDIVCRINSELLGVFTTSKFYGLASQTEREGLAYPVIEGRDVSFDDGYIVSGYHRMTGYTVTKRAGYGNDDKSTNTFKMMLVVNIFKDRLEPDEVALIIQSVMERIKAKDIRINPLSVVLNTKEVFLSEYRGHEYVVKDGQSLIKINYNIEATFKSGCFELCPEDFVNKLN